MNWNSWSWALLALMIWREARGEGIDGMRAVAHVAWNRAGKKEQALATVITKDAQFTSINPYKKTYDEQLDVWPSPLDQRFQEAMTIAHEVIKLVSVDPTNGATYYWNPKASRKGEWFDRTIATIEEPLKPRAGFEVVLAQANHVFYREAAIRRSDVTMDHFG